MNDFKCSGRAGSSRSKCGTRCVTLVTKPMISHQWANDLIVITTHATYPWSIVTQANQLFWRINFIHKICSKEFVSVLLWSAHKATILHYNFVVVAWSFISESPRWLLSRGRKKDAVVILKKIAKMNRKDFSIIAGDITVKADNIQFLEFTKTMLKSKTLMVRLSIIALNWYV